MLMFDDVCLVSNGNQCFIVCAELETSSQELISLRQHGVSVTVWICLVIGHLDGVAMLSANY